MLPSLLFGRNLVAFTCTVYLWTFTLLFSDVVVASDLKKKMAKRRIWRKNGTERVNRDLHTPIYPLPPPPSSLFHMYQKIFMSDLAGQFGTMPGSILREYSIKKNDLLILARFALWTNSVLKKITLNQAQGPYWENRDRGLDKTVQKHRGPIFSRCTPELYSLVKRDLSRDWKC